MTAFSENERTDRGFEPVWFALAADRPLAFSAGTWTRWTSTRKVAEGEVTVDLYGFFTTEENAEVGAIHPKAVLVILTEAAEWDAWLAAPWHEAKALQRPLPDATLTIVGHGAKRNDG